MKDKVKHIINYPKAADYADGLLELYTLSVSTGELTADDVSSYPPRVEEFKQNLTLGFFDGTINATTGETPSMATLKGNIEVVVLAGKARCVFLACWLVVLPTVFVPH